jgi:hypothetical protein
MKIFRNKAGQNAVWRRNLSKAFDKAEIKSRQVVSLIWLMLTKTPR